MMSRGAYTYGIVTPDFGIALVIAVILCALATWRLYPVLERRLRLDLLPWVVFGSLFGGLALSMGVASTVFYNTPLFHNFWLFHHAGRH